MSAGWPRVNRDASLSICCAASAHRRRRASVEAAIPQSECSHQLCAAGLTLNSAATVVTSVIAASVRSVARAVVKFAANLLSWAAAPPSKRSVPSRPYAQARATAPDNQGIRSDKPLIHACPTAKASSPPQQPRRGLRVPRARFAGSRLANIAVASGIAAATSELDRELKVDEIRFKWPAARHLRVMQDFAVRIQVCAVPLS